MRHISADLDAAEPILLSSSLDAGKKVAPDVTRLLAEDHRVVLGWFRWYEQSDDDAIRTVLARRICMALRAHMAAEEDYLYPAVGKSVDRKLAEQAVEEHREARQLMERIEAAADSAQRDGAMSSLQTAIEAHVAEEETQLFPAARGANIDLYAVGRVAAARRADVLLALKRGRAAPTAQLAHEEIPKMHVSQSDARDFFILGLKNAHATTRQGRVLVEAQVQRLENYPMVKEKLRAHLAEKDRQLQRLEALLKGYGESPSVVKDTAMAAAATAAGIASSTAADEVVKNSFATLAQAKYEAAAFETLLVLGEAAGETAALRPLQQSLNESRGLAAFVEENLRGTAIRFLQLRAEGAQAKR